MEKSANKKYYVSKASAKHSLPPKKQQLLAAGLELFAKKGLNGTTIRDIASLANVNSSMISYHYQSKEGLYRSCLQHIGENQLQFLAELLQPVNNEEQYYEILESLASQLIIIFTENKYSGMLLIKEFDLVSSPASDIFDSIFSGTFNSLISFFKSAKKQKVISNKKDEFTLASFCIGLLFSQLRLDFIKNKIYKKSLTNPKQQKLFLQQFIHSLT